MRILLWLILLVTLAAVLAVVGQASDGYVLLVVPPYRVDLSLNFVISAGVVAFLLFYALVRVLSGLMGLPQRVGAWRGRRRSSKAADALRDAGRLFLEGRYGQAIKAAEKAYGLGEGTALPALIAARAAHAMQDHERAAQWLKRAEADERMAGARHMVEAELAIDARQFDEALKALESQPSGRRHLAAMRLELKARMGKRDWNGALAVLRQLDKRDALRREEAQHIRDRIHVENLRSRAGDAEVIEVYWHKLPSAERRRLPVARAAVQVLVGAGGSRFVRGIIEESLAVEWDSDLARYYGDCVDPEDAVRRLAKGEKWLVEHPDDDQLLAALARLCLVQQLWGKAQNYFEASLSVQPTRDVHLELAHLHDRNDRADLANTHYRKAAEPSS